MLWRTATEVAMVNEKWWSLRELNALRTRLAELIDEAMLPSGTTIVPHGGAHFDPPADVWETADEVVVELELPGIAVEQIELTLLNHTLHVAGTSAEENEAGVVFQRIERPRGRFARAIALPVETSGECRAKLHQGVLEVRLTKAPAARRRIVELREET
jgi:HSP20 family protein